MGCFFRIRVCIVFEMIELGFCLHAIGTTVMLCELEGSSIPVRGM